MKSLRLLLALGAASALFAGFARAEKTADTKKEKSSCEESCKGKADKDCCTKDKSCCEKGEKKEEKKP